MKTKDRCEWCLKGNEQIYLDYHDNEWGIPVHDDQKLFEMINLEAFQAGLSWITVLRKRENFRKAFDNFDAVKISKYNERKVESLMKDEGIIRNQLKIRATIINAKEYLRLQKEYGSFDRYIWQFTNHKTINNKPTILKEIQAKTKESDAMSKDLQKQGFKFVGSTICYAFMQAVGMVNDHTTYCWKSKK